MDASSSNAFETGLDIDPMGIFCPNHPQAPLFEDYSAGDQICSECGLVVGDRVINVGAEWRTFNTEGAQGDVSRVGPAQNQLLDSGDLSTLIVGGSGSGIGVSNSTARRTLLASDRALESGFRQINLMAERLNHLPEAISDQACDLFKKVLEGQALKGRSNDAIAAACVYLACRQEDVPRTLKEICAVSNISQKEIGRCYKKVTKALGTTVGLTTSRDYMARFCSNLDLPISVQRAATAISRDAMEMGIVPGRSPVTVAAAAIYMASQVSEMPKSPKEIGVVAGVGAATIRECYKLMYPRAKDLFPKEFTAIESLPFN